jgi:hypothetical protein
MKAVDRVGNPIGIGSIVLWGRRWHIDPIRNYAIVAKVVNSDQVRILKPIKETNHLRKPTGEDTVISCRVRGEIVATSDGVALQFKDLLVVTNVPEAMSTRLYRAVLQRAAKPRG